MVRFPNESSRASPGSGVSGDGPPVPIGSGIGEVLAALAAIAVQDLTLDAELERILDAVRAVPWLGLAAGGAVYLADAVGGHLRPVVARALPSGTDEPTGLRAGACPCGRPATRGAYRHDAGAHAGPGGPERWPAHFALPLVARGRIEGLLVLALDPDRRNDPREDELLRVLPPIVSQIAVQKRTQIELQQTMARLRRTVSNVTRAMGVLFETRDPYTAGHQNRVAVLAADIARRLVLPADRVEATRVAALIHDIGKIAVPSEILNKPGRLSSPERELLRAHPGVGHGILAPIEFPWPIADIVLQHHERLDGSGYPTGLAGSAIRLEARVLAVADVVEAMSNDRPYRAAVGLERAKAEIAEGKGTRYDAAVATACLDVLGTGAYSFTSPNA